MDPYALLSHQREAHLWLVNSADIPVSEDDRLLVLLSPSERQRYHSLFIPKVKREYLVTRAFIRSALSYYAEVAPQRWQFATNQYGRPSLAPQFADLQLEFNISHSHGMVACLIVRQRLAGIDIETWSHVLTSADEQDIVLSQYEQAYLQGHANSGNIHFLHYWTLKEAYSKALGYGLSMNVKNVICVFEQGDCADLIKDGFVELPSPHWQLLQMPILQSHLLTMVISKPTANKLPVRLLEGMPGLGKISSQLIDDLSISKIPRIFVKAEGLVLS